jgi:hypothetical protein
MVFTSLFSRLSIRQKITLIVALTQMFALLAILIGVIGMVLSNHSLSRIHTQSLEPLQNLRTCKNTLEKEITITAKDLSEGVGDFDAASKQIQLSHRKFKSAWETYLKGSLSEPEQTALPEAKKYIEMADRSILSLERAVAARDLMGVLDLLQSDFPFSFDPASTQLDLLIEIQVANAGALYQIAQKEFTQNLWLIAISFPIGMLFVYIILRKNHRRYSGENRLIER